MNALISHRHPDDVERAQNAARQMISIGGDCAWLGEIILAKLPDLPRDRRDRAISDLAHHFIGSRWARAADVRVALGRYATSAWKRTDSNLKSPPQSYAVDPKKLALFAVMHADGSAAHLSQKQIDRILASHCFESTSLGHENPVSMSKALEHRVDQERKGQHMLKNPDISDAQFIGAMKTSSIGQQIVGGEKQRLIAERQAWIDEIAKLDKAANVEFPKLQKGIDLEIAAVRSAEAALRAANEKLNAAVRAKSSVNFQYDIKRRNLEILLLTSAVDDVITKFIRDMNYEMDNTRRKFTGQTETEIQPVTRIRVTKVYNNKASINRRLAAIQAAIEEAGRLRLAADQNDIASRLDTLRASFPEADGVLTHDTGERR